MNYEAQLAAKKAIIRDCLHRIAKIDAPEFQIVAAPNQWHYRSRAQWQFDAQAKRLGYFESGSRRVCDVAECAVLVPELQWVLEDLRAGMGDELLAVLSRLSTQGVSVLISGYRSELYDRLLMHWRRIDYGTTTRGGPVVESLWCNFDEPAQLHDYRFLGSGFRERERLKRKKASWLAKLRRMTPVEASAVLAAIDEWRRDGAPSP